MDRPKPINLGNNWIAYARRHTKSGNAAELTARIAAYQLGNLPREWVKFSQREWLIELAMTKAEYKLALSKAVDTGLVEAKRMKFYDVVVTGLRLTTQAKVNFDRLRKAPILDGSPKEPIYIGEEVDSSSLNEKKQESEALADFAEGKPAMVSVKDIISGSVFKKPKQPNKVSPATIVQLWQTICAEKYPSDYIGPFTIKQRGQIATMLKTCPEPWKVFTDVLSNWLDFVSHVKTEKGLKAAPIKPDLGYFQYHLTSAVNFSKGHALQQPAYVKKPSQPKVTIKQKPAQAEPKPTLKDILAD